MLDGRSLEIISRFKESLLVNGGSKTSAPYSQDFANRSNKLISSPMSALLNDNVLTTKVVEYGGSHRLVLTNDAIERSNYRRKRKWRETYGDSVDIVDGSNDDSTTEGNGIVSNGNGYHKGNGEEEDEDEEEEEEEEEEGGELEVDNEEEQEYRKSANGFNVEDESGEESDFDAETDDINDSNPFKRLKLTEILAPLVHPSEIISHPAILKTYKLTIFNKLASELIELIEIEQVNLNWLNKLLQVLNGEDWFYLLEENLGLPTYDHGLNQFSDDDTSNGAVTEEGTKEDTKSKDLEESKPEESTAATTTATESVEGEVQDLPKRITRTAANAQEDKDEVSDPFFALPESLKTYESYQRQQMEDPSSDELTSIQEDLVNYLQVSIQRQHEYIKNLTQLRNGLVRTDRLKQDLYKWGKEMYEKKSN